MSTPGFGPRQPYPPQGQPPSQPPYQPPYQPQGHGPAMPPAAALRKPKRWPWIVAIVVAFFLGVAVGSPIDDTTTTAASESTETVTTEQQAKPAEDEAGKDQSSAEPTPTPTTVRRTVTEKQPIGYQTKTVRDSSLDKGSREVRTPGVDGARTLTYRVTFVDGERTDKQLVDSKVTKRPVTKVVAVGTKLDRPAQPRCDSNYSGGCVPIASDVDCAGGSGDGPAYVQGAVRVVGIDVYDLDSDSDGYGCE